LYALSFHGHANVLTVDILGAFLHFELPVDTKAKVNSMTEEYLFLIIRLEVN